MKLKMLCASILALASLVPSVSRAADAPTTQAAPISPQLNAAITQLMSEDYQARQDATAKIQAALADGIRAMISLDDPEAQTRMAAIMEYNMGISRWAIKTLQMHGEDRAAYAKWAMSDQVAPLIAKIYSDHPEQRSEGIKELSKNADTQATTLLAHLITDDDRSVRMMAIDAVRDRPVTPVIIEALWNVAMGTVVSTDIRNTTLILRRRIMPGGMQPYYGGPMQDQNAAVDVLIHLKDPAIAERIRSYLAQSVKDADHAATMLTSGLGIPTSAILALTEAYQIKEAIPPLMNMVNGPLVSNTTYNFNGQPAYITNRTAALAAVCLITGQSPEDYKLHKSPELNQWSVPDAASEAQAVEKISKWYDDHKTEFSTTTQPATQAAH